jgi:glycosyltransferase involved in cell wall biosynthesis
MRILLCNYEYPPLGGGGGVASADIAEELAKTHDVTVLTSKGKSGARRDVVNGVVVVRVPVFGRNARSTASLASMLSYVPLAIQEGDRLVRDEPFDVVNTHFAIPTGPAGDRIARRAGIPNVLTVHGGDLYDPSKFLSPHRHAVLRRVVQRQLQRADAVVAQSRNTERNVHRYYVPDLPVELIPLGIKPVPAGSAPRAAFGIPDDAVLMVTIGRLVARKGVDTLIEAVRRASVPNLHLVVIGEGPLSGKLAAQAAEAGISAHVHFTGFVSQADKYGLLHASDFYVSASLHEGFGLVFLEAMACGLPVVCFNEGGQVDFLEDGATGRLIKVGNVDALVAACRELARDRESRALFGKRALACVQPYFIHQCAARYEELFRRVIASKRRMIR